jgi:hypothetical protein
MATHYGKQKQIFKSSKLLAKKQKKPCLCKALKGVNFFLKEL